jgi:hypothetical protein
LTSFGKTSSTRGHRPATDDQLASSWWWRERRRTTDEHGTRDNVNAERDDLRIRLLSEYAHPG